MIGVVADSSEHDVVCEFFELFKTPWEFYQRDRKYEVLLCAGNEQVEADARLVIRYSGKGSQKTAPGLRQEDFRILSYKGNRIPIYGDVATFPEKENNILTDEHSKKAAAYLEQSGQRVQARIGYDLFAEIRTLLVAGQPAANAIEPTLELHIALLRDLITECGVFLVEVPPVPDGYPFITCLTHDVDHPSIRRHKLDHTVLGFVYRALFGSLVSLLRGRTGVQSLFKNWLAISKLPFVYLGIAKDFWLDFDDRYLDLEKGICSTFFVIPFEDRPGSKSDGPAPKIRASRYAAAHIAGTIQKLTAAGSEVALHGIDAWLDSERGREEFEEIRRQTRAPEIGVRMHWLYFDEQSPLVLEKAGATYDSTVGYNQAVGYRAGTTQSYKPLQVTRLLELPLHAMDTSLFYPSYLGLSPRQATTLVGRLVENAVEFGGCLTINWHDRSLSPERLWDSSYRALLQDLKNRGAWFATGSQAVSWFRKRRSVVFETSLTEPDVIRAKILCDHDDRLPGLRLRVHHAREPYQTGAQNSEGYFDMAFDESIDTRVAMLPVVEKRV